MTYGQTWDDIEPTPAMDHNPTTNALDRFVRVSKLIVHEKPTKPMEMYTQDQEIAVQLMKSNNDWPIALSCNKCSAKFHTSFSRMTHMGGHAHA